MKRIVTLFISVILVLSVFGACGLKDKLNGTDANGKKYQKYVKGLMDGSYKGDINAYMSVCDASKEDAQSNYDNCILYYVRSILYAFGFEDYTTVPKAVVDNYTEFVKTMIKETKYSVDKGEKKDKKWFVTIHVSPMNIFTDKAMEEINAYFEDFGEKYNEETTADMTEDEYNNMVVDYLNDLLDILKKHFENREYKDEVSKELEIKVDDKTYSVDDSLWFEVDDLVFYFGEESAESSGSSSAEQ